MYVLREVLPKTRTTASRHYKNLLQVKLNLVNITAKLRSKLLVIGSCEIKAEFYADILEEH